MRIFIAGLGFCGTAAAVRLRMDGHDVLGSNRSGISPLDGLPCVAMDVLSPGGLEGLRAIPEPFDLMIHALSGAGLRDPADYRSLVVDGPRRVADALRWSGIRQMWYLGSTGVYGVNDGSWVDEQTPATPLHLNGELQLCAEEALASAAERVCVLRLSGLYGPGRTRLLRQALRKRPYFKADVWSNQIHRDDVAGVLAFLAANP
jgi:nucleoside-diphosphate-sugar epimerase